MVEEAVYGVFFVGVKGGGLRVIEGEESGSLDEKWGWREDFNERVYSFMVVN